MKKIEQTLADYLKQPYSRVVIPDEESGTYTGQILEFPGCISEGNSAQEAYNRLEEAALSWLQAALDLGQEIPPPALVHDYGGRVALRLPKSLHRQAAIAADRGGTYLHFEGK
jgi:antitoxin HicB